MKELPLGDQTLRVFAGGRTVVDVDKGALDARYVIIGPGIIVKSRGVIEFAFWDGVFSHKNELWSYTPRSSDLELKFAYYLLKSKTAFFINLAKSKSVKMPQLTIPDTDDYLIPIPPIEVQREIVSILDKFTQLEAELEAELAVRKSQYEHTREQLLDFGPDVMPHPMTQLIGELCPDGVEYLQLASCVLTNIGGGTPSRSVERYWHGDIPWASVGDINASGITMGLPRQSISAEGLASSSSKIVPAGWVVVAVKIAPGAMRVVSAPVAINQDIRGLELAPIIDPHFLTYYFKTISIVSNGTIVQGITNKMLESVQVPVPPLDVQKEIVTILDKLDALVNDLTFGLPAEITARRKQYEYYRNKLLTFKELEKA
jgi:type I restriction enzyme S subunit